MISTGETSGELYGSLLSRKLRKLWPDVQIFGIGGARMKAEGVRLIAPIAHVIGIIEGIKHVPQAKRTLDMAARVMLDEKPDILVLIDYPDFNIALAKKAKAAGIPVLYYVSPQVWAWRGGRVYKIAALVNKMAVLFPFEVDYYKKTGLPCEFVGHPITETINLHPSKKEFKKGLGLDPEKSVITLLPGSRPNEISRHQGIIREVAEKIHSEFPEIQIVVPLVTGSSLTEDMPDYMKVIYGRTTEVVACSEASAVASGTATLETALLGTPLVVFYRVSLLTYILGKLLTRTSTIRFFSLVNILSGKKIVLELLQKEAHPDAIFQEIKRMLNDLPYRDCMIRDLNKIRSMMEKKKPSERVASIIGEITGWSGA
ncbi:MAG: lipid-A-disaccharide synthase [Nitrospiraceae bacterium]|nr:MAG: lipid-A-disaccharide synthase [Nitrospiraceae bacterium]